ncbi:MAG: hypothetical protein V7L11_24670 [Nostoc sp.]|uniref:hypothetical protein n=1 Tax=Nostoc sp. TaxID=1180 RepID=UPI002FFC9F6A
MPNRTGYQINSTLHEGIQTIIYQTQKPKTQQRVILKLLKNEYPTLEAFTRIKNEYQIQQGFDSTLLILEHRLKADHNRPAITIIKHYTDIPLVKCYLGQLNQVFMNILMNFDSFSRRFSTSQMS